MGFIEWVNLLSAWLAWASQTASIVKDIVIAIAAAITAYAAWQGLRAWKEQLKGRTEFDLARKILRATYRVRTAILNARSGWIDAAEMAKVREAVGGPEMSPESYAYKQRLRRVWQVLADLEVLHDEAWAVWGDEAASRLKGIHDLVQRLTLAYQLYYSHTVQTDPEGAWATKYRRFHSVLFVWYEPQDAATGGGDKFGQDVEDAVRRVDLFFRKYLN